MRGILALGCCALQLGFGFAAGAAHVHHRAPDPHDPSHGLHVHLDHAHPGAASDPAPAHRHEPSPRPDAETSLDARQVGHHDDDAVYLSVTARRSLDPGARTLPALVAVGPQVAPPSVRSMRRIEPSDPLRGPPAGRTTSARAPPA